MLNYRPAPRSTWVAGLVLTWCFAMAAVTNPLGHAPARAGEAGGSTVLPTGSPPGSDAAEPTPPVATEPTAAEPAAGPAPASTVVRADEGLNFFALLIKGGWLMIPIGLMSLVVVTIVIERTLALRRARVLPSGLIEQLGQLGGKQGSFDPREAYRICQRYPSAAANVVRSMLLKIGRPHSEVEHTVTEASQREADRLFANVRWLTLAAGVTPLIGLLGTVWGMIDAFHRTTQLAPGQNKAEELATGIYIALVTTFAGLMVAIPAAICAHFFEGRIQKLFHQIDELLFNLLPQIERFEGQVRFGQAEHEHEPAEG